MFTSYGTNQGMNSSPVAVKRKRRARAIKFDAEDREEYLTGFHARKLKRRKHGLEMRKKAERSALLERRRVLRAAKLDLASKVVLPDPKDFVRRESRGMAEREDCGEVGVERFEFPDVDIGNEESAVEGLGEKREDQPGTPSDDGLVRGATTVIVKSVDLQPLGGHGGSQLGASSVLHGENKKKSVTGRRKARALERPQRKKRKVSR